MPTIDEIQPILQNLTKGKVTQSDIARALGTGRSNVSLRIKNQSILTVEELKKLGDFYDVNLLMNIPVKQLLNTPEKDTSEYSEPHFILDYYPDVFGSCGTGEFVLSPTKEQIQVPDNVFFKKFSKVKQYSVINAYGDSMQPFIYSGDKLIVEHWNGEQIIDNQVYVFCYDNEIFVKRLTKNINQLVIKSDNTFYDVIKLTGDDLRKIIIIGQIVGLMRDLKR